MNTPIRKHKKSVFCSHLNGRYNSSFRSGLTMFENDVNKNIVSYSNGVPYVNMIWVNRHIVNKEQSSEYIPNKEV